MRKTVFICCCDTFAQGLCPANIGQCRSQETNDPKHLVMFRYGIVDISVLFRVI